MGKIRYGETDTPSRSQKNTRQISKRAAERSGMTIISAKKRPLVKWLKRNY
jgi:hypothetical protein